MNNLAGSDVTIRAQELAQLAARLLHITNGGCLVTEAVVNSLAGTTISPVTLLEV